MLPSAESNGALREQEDEAQEPPDSQGHLGTEGGSGGGKEGGRERNRYGYVGELLRRRAIASHSFSTVAQFVPPSPHSSPSPSLPRA